MKKVIKYCLMLLLLVGAAGALESCRGKSAAQAVEAIEKAVVKNEKNAGKLIKNIGRNADDVVRHVSTKTVVCSTCGGNKQVDYVDEYGNYLYTVDCPNCNGTGVVTKYEFK